MTEELLPHLLLVPRPHQHRPPPIPGPSSAGGISRGHVLRVSVQSGVFCSGSWHACCGLTDLALLTQVTCVEEGGKPYLPRIWCSGCKLGKPALGWCPGEGAPGPGH